MFRRVFAQSTRALIRNFSSNKRPPPGFEKFYKKKEDSQIPPLDHKFPDMQGQIKPQNTKEESKLSHDTQTSENKAPETKKQEDKLSDQSSSENLKDSASNEEKIKENLKKDNTKKDDTKKDDTKKDDPKKDDSKKNTNQI